MTAPARDREDLAAFLLRMRSEAPAGQRLMQAVEELPRRLFFPDVAGDVYADQSLPLPCGETAGSARSAVRIVSALRVQPDSRILEIGTGSGYVTALLAKLGARVTSLERYRGLLKPAGDRLRSCGLTNVALVLEDGRSGYPANAPYDRIVVHGALDSLPRAFMDQMATNGVLVCALGAGDGVQTLVRHQKVGSRFEAEEFGHVRLQPLAKGIAAVL